MLRPVLLLALLITSACGNASDEAILSVIPEEERKSGYEFLLPETQILQDDAFENPGYLWVERGRSAFASQSRSGAACVDCHESDGADLAGAAASYPKIDPESGELLNLEGRINTCRTRHMALEALEYESETLLALTALIANLSKGHALDVQIGADEHEYYLAGQTYFHTRRGQFNLSCAQCHVENWGKQLRGDTISQAYGNGFPAYRLEWQSLGSLHRRLRDCDTGVRAEPLPYGSDTYLAVELYLAARGNGLAVETPAIRR